MRFILTDSEDTEAFGAALWHVLPEKCLVFLFGELGAGKTTLIRGLLREAGYKHTVKSPTYSLVEEYDLPKRKLFHFDLYRLQDPDELEYIGMDDYLRQTALCCIEWPEMGHGYLPDADLEIRMSHLDGGRSITINILQPTLKKSLHLGWKNKDILL